MPPLYARYVPPTASGSNGPGAAAPSESHGATQITVTPNTDSKDGRKKRKRSELEESERKTRKDQSKREKAQVNGAAEDIHMSSGDGAAKTDRVEHGGLPKREKKDKKSNKDYGQATEDGDVQAPEDTIVSETAPTKHDSVLSKYQKATLRSARALSIEPDSEQEPAEKPVLHDLTPLPQPARAPTPEYAPTFSALPHWLARPEVVSPTLTIPFDKLDIPHKTVAHLNAKGYNAAFAVQAALLPMLLPKAFLTHLPPNDICVSAPTGSGKTLGYLLPIVESLRHAPETRLRAVVVVPTRELVTQAYNVASMCAAGSGLKIVTAVGNQSLVSEQETLIRRGRRYDPVEYQRLLAKAKRRIDCESESEGEDQDDLAAAREEAVLHDVARILPHHVPTYTSAADILICTPGRLVEHMNNTLGFSLDDVQWLVIDEADRLLDQSFQEWTDKVVGALETTPASVATTFTAGLRRDRWQREQRYVRKVVLSATMTRDVAKLSALRLRRPTMLVIQHGADKDVDMLDDSQLDLESKSNIADGAQTFELPTGLKEYAVPVGDGAEKPLYLLELLRTKVMQHVEDGQKSGVLSSHNDSNSNSSDDSDNESDTSSDSDSSISSASTSSDDDDNDDSESDSATASSSRSSISASQAPDATKTITTASAVAPTVLIFTASTEAAARLHHLITHLAPSYAATTTLLTKSAHSTNSLLQQPLNSTTSTPRLIIATDRASRGLDLPSLTHVINYSLPRSLEAYVHRVGRTARAGRAGEAWTLFENAEGRWFWNDVARAKEVRRGVEGKGRVERVKVNLTGGDKERKGFASVLQDMREVVSEGGRKGSGKGGRERKE